MTAKSRKPARKPWSDDPEILERVGAAWKLHSRGVPAPLAAEQLGIGVSTYFKDIERGRELLRGVVAAIVADAVSEALSARQLINAELWERLEALKIGRPVFYRKPKKTIPKAKRGEAQQLGIPEGEDPADYEPTEVAGALSPEWADAERAMLESLMKNQTAVEDLLKLRQPPKGEGGEGGKGGGDINFMMIDAAGVERSILLPMVTKALPAPRRD